MNGKAEAGTCTARADGVLLRESGLGFPCKLDSSVGSTNFLFALRSYKLYTAICGLFKSFTHAIYVTHAHTNADVFYVSILMN